MDPNVNRPKEISEQKAEDKVYRINGVPIMNLNQEYVLANEYFIKTLENTLRAQTMLRNMFTNASNSNKN